jgi:hypothetical protein
VPRSVELSGLETDPRPAPNRQQLPSQLDFDRRLSLVREWLRLAPSTSRYEPGWTGPVGGGRGVGMTKAKRLVVALLAASLFAVSAAPAYADAGGGPGSNAGCPGHQPPPPPSGGGCHH